MARLLRDLINGYRSSPSRTRSTRKAGKTGLPSRSPRRSSAVRRRRPAGHQPGSSAEDHRPRRRPAPCWSEAEPDQFRRWTLDAIELATASATPPWFPTAPRAGHHHLRHSLLQEHPARSRPVTPARGERVARNTTACSRIEAPAPPLSTPATAPSGLQVHSQSELKRP